MTPWSPNVAETRALWAAVADLTQEVTDLQERVSMLETVHTEQE